MPCVRRGNRNSTPVRLGFCRMALIHRCRRRSALEKRSTTSAPPGQKPRQGKTPKRAFAPSSHHSNAPIEPVSQSNVSNIFARLTAARASLPEVRIAFPLGRSLTSRSAATRGEHLALSGETAGFFVAFTRAKQRVIFTYCSARGSRAQIAPLYDFLKKAGVQTTSKK